jgi:hypothetical protein
MQTATQTIAAGAPAARDAALCAPPASPERKVER